MRDVFCPPVDDTSFFSDVKYIFLHVQKIIQVLYILLDALVYSNEYRRTVTILILHKSIYSISTVCSVYRCNCTVRNNQTGTVFIILLREKNHSIITLEVYEYQCFLNLMRKEHKEVS